MDYLLFGGGLLGLSGPTSMLTMLVSELDYEVTNQTQGGTEFTC